ncbi:MAG: SH3 domain-containing protein [Chloroflexi bacterium]|nr:SH3 domain-containing protein [Chloroflexota bacterium]
MKRSKILVLLLTSVLIVSCQLTDLVAVFAPTATPTARPRPTATPPVARVIASPPAPTLPPPTAPPQPVPGTIRENSSRVRAEPNTNAAILDRLNKGDAVQVTGRNAANDWVQIILPKDPNGRGWIAATLVNLNAPIDTLPLAPPAPRPYP